jgi:metal transporter CNNM
LLSTGISAVAAAPAGTLEHYHDDVPEEVGASLLVMYLTSVILVLLGGAFAGLTIA